MNPDLPSNYSPISGPEQPGADDNFEAWKSRPEVDPAIVADNATRIYELIMANPQEGTFMLVADPAHSEIIGLHDDLTDIERANRIRVRMTVIRKIDGRLIVDPESVVLIGDGCQVRLDNEATIMASVKQLNNLETD